MPRTATLTALVALAAVSGCGGVTDAPAAPASPAAGASRPPSGPAASPVPATPGARPGEPGAPSPGGDAAAPIPSASQLLTYHRTGGLAGVDDRLVVAADGRYALTTRQGAPRRGYLRPEELAEVRRVLGEARVSTLPKQPAADPVADGFAYEVTVGGRTVRAADGAIPERLEPLLSTVTALVNQLGQ